MPTEFWWGDLKERKQWHDPDVKGRTLLRCVLQQDGRA
jgi:hypothetical protein